MAMTGAERMARLRERQRAGERPVRYRQPKDRRSRIRRDAVDTLLDCLDGWQTWRETMPLGLADSELAERLDEVLELREIVEQLAAAELPSGFGRD